MDNNEDAVKKTELVIKALDYALTFSLDIHKKEDVKKILDELDPEHAIDADVESFMKLLVNTDTFMVIQARRNESEKENQSN